MRLTLALWFTALTAWFYAILAPEPLPLVAVNCGKFAKHPICRGVSQSEYVASIRSRALPTVLAAPIQGGK